MMSGGPIIEYLRNWCGERLNTLCFVGYQAEGTLGRRLKDGFKDVQAAALMEAATGKQTSK